MSGVPRNDNNFASVGTDYSSPQYSSGNTNTDNSSPQYPSSTRATDNPFSSHSATNTAATTDFASPQYVAGNDPTNATGFSSPLHAAGTQTTHTNHDNNPSHHVRHDESEPLPGTQGARDTVDYSTDNLDTDNTSWARDKHTAAADYASTNERRTDSERLPSAIGGRDAVDDRTNNLGKEDSSQSRGKHTSDVNSSTNKGHDNLGGTDSDLEDKFYRHDDPTHAGFGKDIDAGETKGHAGVGDKVIGKTQQIVGKMTNNPDLREKGELRETNGKEGVYRAPRD